ncbi:MAG: hypothetical protein H0T09_02095 [Actinobacteria bacterium]|nr:hypothetical protein [Actinomycetota bacterium]
MTVETASYFAKVIQDHLDLKRRNAELEPAMPIDTYKGADPFHNHPLFKTEQQARLEDTMSGQEVVTHAQATALAWPAEESAEDAPEAFENLWSRSRDFDWGD